MVHGCNTGPGPLKSAVLSISFGTSTDKKKNARSGKNPHTRFRLAIRPTHRAPRSRAERLLPDRPPRPPRRAHCRAEAQRDHSFRRARQRLRPESANVRPEDLRIAACPSWASATACSWPATSWAGKFRPDKAASSAAPCARYWRPTACSRTLPEDSIVWMSHGDQVQVMDGNFTPLAATDTCPLAAVRHRTLPVFGLQFHPEVSHTPDGSQILAQFPVQDLRLHG